MRTTLNIDDQILAIAKHRAIEQGVTLTCVVENALRDAFFKTERKSAGIHLLTVKGPGVKPYRYTQVIWRIHKDVDDSVRLYG